MTIPVNQKDLKELYNHLKSSAKKRKIPFSLSMADMYEISFPISCPILSIELKFNTGSQDDNSFSFDRIDSTKGYSIDNIVVISQKANRIKNNGTPEELAKLAKFYNPEPLM